MKWMTNKALLCIALLTTNTLSATENFDEASLEEILEKKSELKAQIGSREESKNFLDSRSPVDVITYEQIEKSGATSLIEALRYFVAGFNAPSTTVTDGSDHVQLYSLRGMSPDQILVLINGKRLHTSGLVHVNSTIGYGSSHVDLDTIALASIERVEILRDGAAAQYGSDAIAGVINIILKGSGHQNSMTLHSGQRKEGDGLKLYADTFVSHPLKNDGFVNLALSVQQQDQTQRAGADTRVTPAEVHTHVGIPDSTSFNAVLNAENLEIDDVVLYSNALFNYRDSKASAFYRTPDPARPIYPDGFLPMINAQILDYSLAVGAKGKFSDIDWDLSNVYGANQFKLGVDNTMNYSLGASSPTSFENGSLNFVQNTTNLDLKKKISALTLSGGAEYRYENYQIKAGEFSSYTGSGSQGFAGYMPQNEVDASRNSFALYLDGVYDFTKDLSAEGALRHENFSDFGSTTNYKLSVGYKIIPEWLLRTSASTGFRAPALAQSNFSFTSYYTSGGPLTKQGLFKISDPISQYLGAIPLKPETSKHLTFGSVYQPTKEMSLMVDYFYTEVQDRITVSKSFAADPLNPQDVAVFTSNDVYKARFFTNAVDTKTHGIDAKFNYEHTLADSSELDFSVWYSYNKNRVTAFNDNQITYVHIDRIENAQPKDAVRIFTNYKTSDFDVTLNFSRYGSYQQVINDKPYTFEPAWTTDLEIAYQVNSDIKLSVGGTNIFDAMPNTWDGLSGTYYGYDGMLPYSNYSPFGYSGAYYYAKAVIKF